MIDTPS
jgi:hypothetical protein